MSAKLDFIEIPGDELGRKWLHPKSKKPLGHYLKGYALEVEREEGQGLCTTCEHGAWDWEDSIVCRKLPTTFDANGVANGVAGMFPAGHEAQQPILVKCRARQDRN